MAIGLITTPASWVNGTVAPPTWFQDVQDTLNNIFAGSRNRFGDGSSGSPTVTTTIAPAQNYGSVTVNSGGNINLTAGYTVLYVDGTLTMNAGGKLSANGLTGGNGGLGSGGGAIGISATYPHAGGGGANGTLSGAATIAPPVQFGIGGLGGTGGSSDNAGPLYVTPTTNKPWLNGNLFFHTFARSITNTPSQCLLTPISGGSGGGGGRGDGANGGGQGGMGAGALIVIARNIVWNVGATWEAIGGAGGNGHTTGNTDGGGGGGGGGALFVYQSLTGTIPNGTVTGGAGGAKNGTGNPGNGGGTGIAAPFLLNLGA